MRRSAGTATSDIKHTSSTTNAAGGGRSEAKLCCPRGRGLEVKPSEPWHGGLVCPLAASLDRSLHVCAREFAGTRLASRLRGCESCSQNTIVARKAPAKDYQRGRITAQLCVLQDLLTRAGKLSADRLQNTARPQSQSLNAAAATQQCASPSAAAAWNTSGPAP